MVGLSRQRELRAASMSHLQSGNREDGCILYYSMVLRLWEQGMESHGSKVMCVRAQGSEGKGICDTSLKPESGPRLHKEMAGENQKAVI